MPKEVKIKEPREMSVLREKGSGRPTKADRRAIDKLMDRN